MLYKTIEFLFILLASLAPENNVPLKREVCISTQYGLPGDKMAGGLTACTGKRVYPDSVGIAHRTLPCGHQVRVTNPRTGLSTYATVIDRGPYGAMTSEGWVLKRRPSDPGVWRGCADLTGAVGKAIGHDGWDQVVLTYVDPRVGKKRRSVNLATVIRVHQLHRIFRRSRVQDNS